MKRLKPAFLVAILSIAPGLASAQEIGRANEVIRIVHAVLGEGERDLATQDPVHFEERLTTDANSSGILLLRDDTRFIVGPSSDVILDSFVYDPTQEAGEIALSVTKGVLRFVTGKVRPDGITIRTPTSTIGIRGTDFTLLVDNTSVTHLAVSDGRVLFRSLTNGFEAELGPGQSIRSDAAGGQVSEISPSLAAAAAAMSATVAVSTTPAKAVPPARVSAVSAATAAANAARAAAPATSDTAAGTHY